MDKQFFHSKFLQNQGEFGEKKKNIIATKSIDNSGMVERALKPVFPCLNDKPYPNMQNKEQAWCLSLRLRRSN